MRRYSVEDLLEAYRRAVARPSYGLAAFRVYDEHVLDCMSRCFGVSFEGEAAASLRAVLDQEAQLPHPLAGYLESSLLAIRFGPALTKLEECRAELSAFYRRRALELAAELWGVLGERTIEQLREAGWDPDREPKLDDLIEEL